MMETNTARIELRDKQLLIVRIKDGASVTGGRQGEPGHGHR
jgi:hypothetical protein